MENNDASLNESRKLDFKDRNKIVTFILACRCMESEDTRDTIFAQFSEDYPKIAATFPKRDKIEDYVRGVVSTCLKHPGILEYFAKVIAEFEQSYSNSEYKLEQQLRELIHTLLVSQLFSLQLYDELTEITATLDITKKDLLKICLDSLPSSQYEESDKFKSRDHNSTWTLSRILRQLVEMPPQRDGTHPLLTFMTRLSNHVLDKEKRDALIQWRDRATEETGFRFEKGHVPDTTVGQLSSSSFHLLVKFDPDYQDANGRLDTFIISTQFIHKQNDRIEILRGNSGESLNVSAIPALIEKEVDLCESKLFNQEGTFTIELFLPYTLLHCTICDHLHEWKYRDSEGNYTPISEKYPIVVRSYDRVYANSGESKEKKVAGWRLWASNWRACKKHEGDIDLTTRLLLKEDFYHENKVNLHRFLQEVICLRITFVPPQFDGNPEQQHLFKKMVGAGICAALWPRSKDGWCEEVAIEQVYNELLLESKFSSLSKIIWNKRKEDNKLAKSVTLFLDNPEILLDDAPSPLNHYWKFSSSEKGNRL